MPVWWADFFNKTDHLSNEEQWAYLKLMAKTWVRNCRPITDNDADIARLLNIGIKRWRHIRSRIEPFFDLSEGTWRQPHLENVFRECAQRKDISRSNGALGGRPRSNHINDIPKPMGSPQKTHRQTIINTRKKDSDSPDGESAAVDPIKDLWDRGKAVLGDAKSAGALIGKLRRQYGDVVVLQAIIAAESELPSDPASFLIGCCNRAKANGNGQATRTAASERFLVSRQDTLDAALQLKREREASERGAGGC